MNIKKLSVIVLGMYTYVNCDMKKEIIQFPQKISNLPIQPSISSGKVTSARILGNVLINNKIAGKIIFSGSVQFFPSIDEAVFPHHIENAQLKDISSKEGVFEGTYEIDLPNRKTNTMTVSTKHAGKIYVCPSPSELYIHNQWPTPYVKIQTHPRCEGHSAAFCRLMTNTMYVDRNRLVVPHTVSHSLNLVASDHYYLKDENADTIEKVYIHKHSNVDNHEIKSEFLKHVTHGTVVAKNIPTNLVKDPIMPSQPLRVKLLTDENGSKKLYHYVFEASCADILLRSSSNLPFPLEKSNVSDTFLGFEKNTLTHSLLNSQNQSLIPPLHATKFTLDDKNKVTMSCIYCEEDKQDEAVIISGQLPKKVEDHFIYGKDSQIKNREYHDTPLADIIKNTLVNKGDITITSPQPVAVVVTIE